MAHFTLDNLPYYSRVPKTLEANLRYRRAVLKACAESEEVRREWWMACSRDPLLYVNTFLWIHEPRDSKTMPWITYEYEDGYILDIINRVGVKDLFVDKARDMGVTWCTCLAFEWYWHFRENCSFHVLSWKESLVDKKGSKATIFFKFDFMHDPKYVPGWLIPNIYRKFLHATNLDGNNTFEGESSSESSGVANRVTALWADEFGLHDGPQGKNGMKIWDQTADVTKSRFATTTAKGVNNCAYQVKNSGIDHIHLPWHIHPLKRPGLYRVEDGEVEIIDTSYQFPENYKFIASIEDAIDAFRKPAFWNKEYRSPWFDNECKRRGTVTLIAQEILCNYLGAGTGFFKEVDTEKILSDDCRTPLSRGDIVYSSDYRPIRVEQKERGRIEFWINLDARGRPPGGRRYGMGVDISQGSGASNSVISVIDRLTREKVAQFVSPHVTPTELAHIGMAMGYLFAGDDPAGCAEIIYEKNGPGMSFGKVIHSEGYPNVYFMEHVDNYKQPTKTPGWHTNPKSKQILFEAFLIALMERTYVQRSDTALKEIDSYVHDPGGTILHVGSINQDDPSGAKQNHGDIVIGDALSNWLIHDTADAQEESEQEPPPYSFGARMRELDEELAQDKAGKGWFVGAGVGGQVWVN